MGERKGVNKYYPPDYDPRRGGLNKFQGTHALRERARKLHLGILIIRFEMPYNIWCEGCNKHIGMGVRYNAEKKKVGMYYSTPIYQFRMKCHLCDNYFEIKTDPANLDYEIVSGARRQEKRWDPTENEQVVPEDKEVTRKMAVDAMFKLEHGVGDKAKSQEVDPVLQELEEFQAKRWHDDYASNRTLRAAMRVKRMEAQTQAARDASYHLSVPLLPPNEEDTKTAKLLQFTQSKSSDQLREERRAVIDAQSVFAKLRTKKVPQTAKKAYAHQSLKDIVNNSQKNFNNFKNNFGSQALGIVPRKVGIQNSSEKLNDESEKEVKSNTESRDSSFVENSLSTVSPISSSDPHKTPKDSAEYTTYHTSAHNSSLSSNTDHSNSVFDSETQQSILQQAPENSSETQQSILQQAPENSTCVNTNRVHCLVSYDLSASESDDSLH